MAAQSIQRGDEVAERAVAIGVIPDGQAENVAEKQAWMIRVQREHA